MRIAKAITLTDEERVTLSKWSRGRSTPARLVQRAKIVLAAADGRENKEIAVELGKDGYVYRLREIYEVPDLQAGGARPVRNELATLPVGSEVEVARRAVVHLVGSRVNSALDAAA